ncbi:hypothetical protein DRQ53_13805, partial [bacterium]
NILGQAFGSCDVADLAQLEAVIARRELVVIGRRSCLALDSEQVNLLGRHVEAGLTVLLEAPDSTLCRQLGLELAAVERRLRLPWPTPAIASRELLPVVRPRALDVPWTRLRYAPTTRRSRLRPQVRLSLDGRPLGWILEHGQGNWSALAMDFADLATRIRQGSAIGPINDAQDRVIDHAPFADDAWLDAWVEGILGGTLTRLPLARIASAPFDADGWLICGAHAPVDNAVPPTLTVFASVFAPDAGAAAMLGWWPDHATLRAAAPQLVERYGVGPLRPFARVRDLALQRTAIGTAPSIMRLAGDGLWDTTDEAFARIAGAGFSIDTSLTPRSGEAAWFFGSGVPFTPLARDGLPVALLEVPAHMQLGDEALDERRLDRWMRHNARGGAGPIQIDTGPHWTPQLQERLDRLAERHQHTARSLTDLTRWWQQRAELRVRSRALDDGQELLIEQVPGEGFALLIPMRWLDRALTGWEADWGVTRSRRVQRFDRAYRLLEIGPASVGGRLRLRYR